MQSKAKKYGEYVEITADTKDFELGMTMTMASCDVLSDLGLSDLDNSTATDKLKSDMDTLNSSMNSIVDGSGKLTNGSKDLKNGLDTLYAGTKTLKSGTDSLSSKAPELVAGVNKLNDSSLLHSLTLFEFILECTQSSLKSSFGK